MNLLKRKADTAQGATRNISLFKTGRNEIIIVNVIWSCGNGLGIMASMTVTVAKYYQWNWRQTKPPPKITHSTHILILPVWRQKALKLRLSPWLVSDKIIPSARGLRLHFTHTGTENLLCNPLPCRPDLLLAERINLIFLWLDSNKEKLFGANVAQTDLDGAYIPKFSLMARLHVCCVSFSLTYIASGRL